MRVLYLHNGSDLYGASRSLLRLVTQVPAVSPHVVLPSEGPLGEACRSAGVPVTVLPSMAILTRQLGRPRAAAAFGRNMWQSARRIAALARAIDAQLIHTNVGSVASAGLAARLSRLPHVWHVRDSFREFGPLWTLYSRYIRATSDAIVCVSGSVAEQFAGASGNLHVLHNGLPVDESIEVSADRVAAFERRFGLSGVRTVGLVGRIKFQRKGHDFFVRAAAQLAAAWPDVRFVIVGSPFPGNEDHLVRLRALIGQLGLGERVVLTGDVSDSRAAIRSLDILVLASCQPEPFAGVVLEAMSQGVPVVGTSIGGTVEQVVHGETGLLVPPNDVAALARALDDLLRRPDEARRIGQAARARLQTEFSFVTMADRLLSIYASVLHTPIPEPSRSAIA